MVFKGVEKPQKRGAVDLRAYVATSPISPEPSLPLENIYLWLMRPRFRGWCGEVPISCPGGQLTHTEASRDSAQ